ncbi:hypothetical protein NU219Hw_g8892t1 [Hortaea werneckii]
MDGRNCTGRTISLLNDSSDATKTAPPSTSLAHNTTTSQTRSSSYYPSHPAKIQLPPLTAHSRASSCASTPSLSPQTPQLLRSFSSEGRGALSTPSPLTPTSSYGFDQTASQQHRSHPQHYYALPQHMYAKMDDQNGPSMYPPIPDATGAMPYPMPMPQQLAPQPPMQTQQQHQQQQYRASTSPSSEPSRVSNVSNPASAAKAPPKKNQYPCPMAKQVGCTDFFTTSGHAARHAKKHTGKKDAICPDCNKAFTRKDNMEQHRRTHQNGRTGRSSDDNKVKKAKAAPKKAVKSDAQLEAAVEQLAEPAQDGGESQPPVQQPMPPQMSAPMPQPIDQSLMMQPPNAGMPYFLGNSLDTGPVPPLPMAVPDLNGVRPPLQRSNYQNSLEYMPTMNAAHTTLSDDPLHFAYPSPGLSNGLNSLALAASEHQRLSEEKASRSPPSDPPSD